MGCFQSARPVWDATRFPSRRRDRIVVFNPRVPCGTRPDQAELVGRCFFVSIRASRVGRDRHGSNGLGHNSVSIRASRVGRDPSPSASVAALPSFNPRVPCGTRRCDNFRERSLLVFQSARPVWDATCRQTPSLPATEFQSARPVWDATTLVRFRHPQLTCFNPRVPCGTRRTWN